MTSNHSQQPSLTNSNLSIVSKLKHRVPKRLSLTPSSRSPSISPPHTRSRPDPPSPIPTIIRFRIDSARNLISKDRNGKSDPFVKISLLNNNQNSGTQSLLLHDRSRLVSETRYASLDPVWYQSETGLDLGAATIEVIVYPSTFTSTVFKVVVFDKDRLKNDYLGELEFGLIDWICPQGLDNQNHHPGQVEPSEWRFETSSPRWISLSSSKSRTKVTGELSIRIGFLPPSSFRDSIPRPLRSTILPSSLVSRSHSNSLPATPVRTSSQPQPSDDDDNDEDEEEKVDDDERISDIMNLIYNSVTSSNISPPSQNRIPVGSSTPMRAEEMTDENEKRMTKILDSNKKLREIIFRKIRRKSTPLIPGYDSSSNPIITTTPMATNIPGIIGDQNPEDELEDEAGLVRGKSVLGAHPTLGVGTQAKSRTVSGQELSEGIGDLSDEDGLSSIISTDSESSEYEEESEEERGNSSSDSRTRSHHLGAQSRAHENIQKIKSENLIPRTSSDVEVLTSSNSITLEPPPPISRTSSSSSGKKLLLLPGTLLTKTIPSGIKALTPSMKSNVLHSELKPMKTVRLSEPKSPTVMRKKTVDTKFRLRKRKSDHSFKDGHLTKDDVMGICFIELDRATGLPYWKAVTRIGFDMDPFVIISFGEKIFRTKVIRHSLEPVWDERLFFHVKREELSYSILFSLFDWDKMSSNDYIGETRLKMSSLVEKSVELMEVDQETKLYTVDEQGRLKGDQMISYEFEIVNQSSKPSSSSSQSSDLNPSSTVNSSTVTTVSKLYIKAKYVPYSALRQIFWRKYLESFDTDGSGTISGIELVSMLDSLGSTLSSETIETFFTRFGKSAHVASDSLSIEHVIVCLEEELVKRPDQKRKIKRRKSVKDFKEDDEQEEEEEEGYLPCSTDAPLGFVGHNPVHTVVEEKDESGRMSDRDEGKEDVFTDYNDENHNDNDEDEEDDDETRREKVINISRCPICHKQRINSRMEIDIVTHLAVCASTDWSSLTHILSPGNFVTSNQANRKWFTKVIGKVQNGRYSLGADSANIIVKDRMSGGLVEEKMQVVVRLGIRLMYRSGGSKSRMEKDRVRSMLKSLTIKQGQKYDHPDSRREIEGFVEFHGLDLSEVLRPINSFETFNQFFYRELRPGSRPIDGIDDPGMMVSAADCRMMVFEDVEKSRSIWIKGKSFGLEKVLGSKLVKVEESGWDDEKSWSIGIFRLAPQDYHRFHSPVDGTVEAIERIDGQYYTVNPMAIRSTIDVYGENVRVIVVMNTEAFGKVYCVLVGAMMVGSIEVGVEIGDRLRKGDHLGYFAFGGSTILVIGKSDMIEWDQDLLANSRAPIETLVRVGNRVAMTKKKRRSS